MAASPRPEPEPSAAVRWLAGLAPSEGHPDLGPLQLAWLGDAVWELHQRLRSCRHPGRTGDLHRSVVALVNAEAQARALERLEPWLAAGERELVRRGRNRAGRAPRSTDAGSYGRSTGFETMVGWLFLRNPRRLAELLDHLEETDLPSDPPTDEPQP